MGMGEKFPIQNELEGFHCRPDRDTDRNHCWMVAIRPRSVTGQPYLRDRPPAKAGSLCQRKNRAIHRRHGRTRRFPPVSGLQAGKIDDVNALAYAVILGVFEIDQIFIAQEVEFCLGCRIVYNLGSSCSMHVVASIDAFDGEIVIAHALWEVSWPRRRRCVPDHSSGWRISPFLEQVLRSPWSIPHACLSSQM